MLVFIYCTVLFLWGRDFIKHRGFIMDWNLQNQQTAKEMEKWLTYILTFRYI